MTLGLILSLIFMSIKLCNFGNIIPNWEWYMVFLPLIVELGLEISLLLIFKTMEKVF